MKISFAGSLAHLQKTLRPTHGPQAWKWWHLFSFSFVKLTIRPPNFGYRLWVYSRWGAIHFDLYIDRRKKVNNT